jgi:DNA mismatch repair ATPase MutL
LAERLSIKEDKVMNKQEIMYLISELFKLTDIEELPNKEKVLIKIDNTFLKSVFH